VSGHLPPNRSIHVLVSGIIYKVNEGTPYKSLGPSVTKYQNLNQWTEFFKIKHRRPSLKAAGNS
jgi:hypothetical protein